MAKMEKCLVIGSNSFSGASFIDYLLQQGVETIGTSRSPEAHRAFLPYRWSGKDTGFRFVQCDLNHDLDRLTALMQAEKPAYVVNFAAQSMVGESWKNPDHWFMTNVVSAVKLHDRLRQCDYLQKYVHVTTPEVYGSTDGWIREDTGKFYSARCTPWGFTGGEYTTRIEGDKTYFEAMTASPKHGRISWSGEIEGDTITGTYVWTKERWYWKDARQDKWFRGVVKH